MAFTPEPPGEVRPRLEREEAHAVAAARTPWFEHRRVYGAHQLTAEVHDRGHGRNQHAGRPADALGGVHRRQRGDYGHRSAPPATAPDWVERNSTPTAPNQLRVADVSPLPTWCAGCRRPPADDLA